MAIQKNNVQSADILLQFTNVLAKSFSNTLTDIANYLSSLSTNTFFGIPILLIPFVPLISTLRPTTHSQIIISSIFT